MKIVTSSEMREIDRATSQRFGVPSVVLMENAGGAVAEFVGAHFASAETIGVVCGKGNNGGDGLVAARKLHEAGKQVRLLLLTEVAGLAGDALEMARRLPISPRIVGTLQDFESSRAEEVFASDLLIDALLGTGFRPPLEALYAEAIRRLNRASRPVVSVDVPSGTAADSVQQPKDGSVRASGIVTFTAPRPAHVLGSLSEGPLRIYSIGSPDAAIASSLNLNLVTAREVAPLIGPRAPNANKGSFGHVLVLGGSTGKAGAAAMAGMAALKAGAGLSTVGTSRQAAPTVAGFYPELMTEALAETAAGSISLKASERVDQLLAKISVLAVGPGISGDAETAEFVRDVIARSQKPTVLDADGLNAFHLRNQDLRGQGRQLVITPHPGEMARLLDSTIADVEHDRLRVARSFASEHGVTVVLKGHRTVVARPDGEAWVNATGNAGMATGGTGDILTGMVAALMAQHPERSFDAVIAAVYLHGAAGVVARERMGEQSLVATDLIAAFPEAFRRTRQAASLPFVEITS